MYSITAILWSYENGQLVSSEENLFHPDTQDDFPVVDATGSFEISEGGSVQFTLAYTHPLYDALTPLETYLRVMDDDEELFYGRILSRSDPTFTGQISYVGEGALSFLRDGEVPPEARDAKGQQGKRTMTAEAFFRWCIEQHNATVGDPRRQFTVGQITIDKKNESREYQVTSYTDTRSAIDQYLRNIYGGYLRTRSDGNGGQYIDWIKQYDRLNPQAIEIGVNVMELSNTLNADGIYTVLRPVGANGLLLNPETIDLFPPEKMAVIGRIVKSVTFQNADTAEKLQAVAEEYAARIGQSLLSEVNIRLVDMHYLDGTSPKIRIGDRFNNIIGTDGAEFTIGHIDADFLHAANDSFSFKNVNDLEGDLNSGLGGGTISRATSRGARSAGLGLKYYSETTDKAALHTKEIEIRADELLTIIANNARIATTNYERISRTFEVAEGYTLNQWADWEPNHLYHKGDKVSRIENHKRVGYECLEDEYTSREAWDEEEKTHWEPVESVMTSLLNLWGTDVIQNSNQIAQVAGNFQVLTDYYTDWPNWLPDHDYKVNDRIKRSVGGKDYGYVCVIAHHSSANFEDDLNSYWEEQHNRKSVRLLDGAAFEIDDLNGNMMTVGARIDTLGNNVTNLYDVVDDQGLIITGMVGSALWTQREHITGVSGEFDVVTDTKTGKKRLVIKSGGGMTLSRNNAEYGLYDEGNMTGGLLVDRINTESWNSWMPNTFYAKGSAVKVNNVGYICLEDHTSSAEWSGAQGDSSKWRESAQTKIKGDIVDIEARQVRVGSTKNVETWLTEQEQDIDDLEGLVADKATIADLNAAKARISTLEVDDLIMNGTLSVQGGDIFTTGNINAGLNMGNYIRGKTLRLIGASSSQGAQEAILNYNDVNGMIVKAEVSDNNLRLWKHGDDISGDPSITFSKATSLTGAWGSGSDSGYYVVTASPQGNKYRYDPPLRLNGTTAASNFSAEIYDSTSGTPVVRKSVYGYLIFNSNGASSSVSVNTENDGTGTAVSSISVGNLYTAGQNNVTITKGSWSGGKISFTKSAGTESTKSVQLTAADTTWSGNTGSCVIWDGTAADAQHGVSTGYTVSIDASGRYTAGQNNVTITKGSWNGGQVQFTKSAGTASTKGVKVGLSGSWSNGVYSYTINDYYDNSQGVSTGYSSTISAPSVTVSAGSWSSGSVTVTAKHGTKQLGSTTVSVPAVTATSWVNTTGRTWRADVTIGGVSRSSSTKDFSGYYTDGYNAGGATAKVNQSTQTLSYGGSVTVTAQYVNSSGTTVSTSSSCKISAPTDSNLVAGNIKSGVTIFGVAGTYAGGGSINPASDISLNSPTWYDSTASLPSADATLNTMGSVFNSHKNGRGYIYFNITISGVSGKKVYRVPVGT